MQHFSKPSLLIGFVAALLIAFGCEREPVKPTVPDLSGLKTDLSDPTMTADEFMALYNRVGEIAQNPPADQPTVNAWAWAINRRFNITWGTNIAVGVGGAVYNRPTSEWLAGASAGSVPVSPTDIQQLINGLPHRVRLIEEQNWFPIHQLRIVFEDQGNYTIYGLIDSNSGNYTFLGAAAAGNNSCGAIVIGRVYGVVDIYNQLSIAAGEYGYGLALACSPAAVGGTISMNYTGVAIP